MVKNEIVFNRENTKINAKKTLRVDYETFQAIKIQKYENRFKYDLNMKNHLKIGFNENNKNHQISVN